jgi:hypothetical protein
VLRVLVEFGVEEAPLCDAWGCFHCFLRDFCLAACSFFSRGEDRAVGIWNFLALALEFDAAAGSVCDCAPAYGSKEEVFLLIAYPGLTPLG